MKVEITIGWTKSDRESGYSSFSDGYRHGAEQHTETMEVEVADDYVKDHGPDVVMHIAEWAFEATNAPFPHSKVAKQINEELERRSFYGEQSGHYSLSVGDTVTVGEVMLACEAFGWKHFYAGEAATRGLGVKA